MRAATYRAATFCVAMILSLVLAAGAVASCPSPTHSLSLVKVGSVTGSGVQFSTFGPWAQHIVKTLNGLFAVYFYTFDTTNGGYWRLMRSTNGGSTWSTTYDSKNDGLMQGLAIDADSSGNVYVVGGTNWSGPTYFYKFPAGAYGTHTKTALSYNGQQSGSAKKISAVYNPTYNQVDVLLKDVGARPEFFAVNPGGTVAHAAQLWGATQPHSIMVEYPNIQVGSGGEVYAGWSTEDEPLNNNGSGTQNYYDAHFLASSDGGQTWDGPGGQVSLPIDDTNAGPSYEIVNTSDTNEFIPYGNSSYHGNWNLLDSFAYNNGALHFFFQGPLPANHASYAQLSWPGTTFSNRTDSFGSGNGNAIPAQSDGSFTQANNTFTGSFYFLGQTNAASGYRKLIAMNTLDGGASWCTYATSSWSAPTSDIRYIGAARFEGSGLITGIFTDQTSSTSATVYFVKSG